MLFRGALDAGMIGSSVTFGRGFPRVFRRQSLPADFLLQTRFIMIFFVTTGFLFGLMNFYFTQSKIGARDVAFPPPQYLSFWLYVSEPSYKYVFLYLVGSLPPPVGWPSRRFRISL